MEKEKRPGCYEGDGKQECVRVGCELVDDCIHRGGKDTDSKRGSDNRGKMEGGLPVQR